MSIDSQVILKITITQGSEGGAANFPFVNFRCHSFKTLLTCYWEYFYYKERRPSPRVEPGPRSRTFRILISLPYTTRHSSAKFESMIDRRLKFMFFSPLKLSMNFWITLQCLKSIVWRKSKTHIALAKSIYYILSNIGQPLAQPQ